MTLSLKNGLKKNMKTIANTLEQSGRVKLVHQILPSGDEFWLVFVDEIDIFMSPRENLARSAYTGACRTIKIIER